MHTYVYTMTGVWLLILCTSCSHLRMKDAAAAFRRQRRESFFAFTLSWLQIIASHYDYSVLGIRSKQPCSRESGNTTYCRESAKRRVTMLVAFLASQTGRSADGLFLGSDKTKLGWAWPSFGTKGSIDNGGDGDSANRLWWIKASRIGGISPARDGFIQGSCSFRCQPCPLRLIRVNMAWLPV